MTNESVNTGYNITFQDITSGEPGVPEIIYEATDLDDLYRAFSEKYEEDFAQYCPTYPQGTTCPEVPIVRGGYKIVTPEYVYLYMMQFPDGVEAKPE